MAQRAENPDAFQAAIYALDDVINDEPVDKKVLFEHIENAEEVGKRSIKENWKKPDYVARALRKCLMNITYVEVVPPLNKTELKSIADKAGMYAMMLELSEPQNPSRPAKPTPTKAIPTSSRKI